MEDGVSEILSNQCVAADLFAVYTCQKPQHKRCTFFLWTDDAKIREEAAVLSNSRSEPPPAPTTPRKATSNAIPPTPETGPRKGALPDTKSCRGDKEEGKLNHDESFDWSSSNDEELLKAEQEMLSNKTPFETPKKTPRTQTFTSPGKRTLDQMTGPESVADDR